ncbi:MAG TPA: amidohydrolase family protein [Sphingomicrobium sp.]|nr:amidohydrolase family protein [Sphingomicrobium sp.]
MSSGAQAQEGVTALVNANLIDGRGNAPLADQTILIADGRISAVFPSGNRPLPKGTRIIDLTGQTVLPGLIEGHLHLSPNPEAAAGLREMLRAGITTVRDVGGDARVMQELTSQAAAAPNTMPDLVYSAFLYGPQFLADPRPAAQSQGVEPGTAAWSRMVTQDSDIAAAVAEAKATGATGLKLYASIGPDLLRRIVEEADRQGMKTWVHSAVFPAAVHHVVAAQPDQIIHAKGFITAGATDLPDNFAEGTGKWIAAQDFRGTDPNAPRFRALFASMVDAGAILEPALLADIDLPERRLAPPPAALATGSDARRQSRPVWLQHMAKWACGLTGVAYKAGVTISAGTDTFGNQPFLARELSRLVECGLSPLDAIRAATYNNAKAMGLEKSIGSIEEGKRADLLVLAADPASDISRINDVRMVMKNGRVVNIAD